MTEYTKYLTTREMALKRARERIEQMRINEIATTGKTTEVSFILSELCTAIEATKP